MSPVETYRQVKKSVVAITPRYIPVRSADEKFKSVPPIIGTGFIVDDGLVATNDHVIRAIEQLPRPPDPPDDRLPAAVLLFHEIPEKGTAEKGTAQVILEVLGAFTVKNMKVQGAYYGPERLDFGFLHVKAKGLPSIPVSSDATAIQEGIEVATAGFPMGTRLLKAPGWEHQFTPTLQSGVISAVLPFPCEAPHAFIVNVMAQGGTSGSPVFLHDDPAAVGILYGGAIDYMETDQGKYYPVPTNMSYVIPGHFLANVIERVRKDPQLALPAGTKSLQEILDSAEFVPFVRTDLPSKEEQ